jgi:hypothetical protein
MITRNKGHHPLLSTWRLFDTWQTASTAVSATVPLGGVMFLAAIERRGVGRTSLRLALPGVVVGLAIGLIAPVGPRARVAVAVAVPAATLG